MANVFVSYSSADKQYAGELVEGLQRLGHKVFYAGFLTPGTELVQSTAEALQAADAVVVVVSDKSAESQSISAEIPIALSYAHTSSRVTLIPVVRHGAPLEGLLASRQAILDNDDDAVTVVHQIAEAIAAFLGARAAAQQEEEVTQRRIQENAAEYVNEAVDAQKTAEKRYRHAGTAWYIAGILALTSGLIYTAVNFHHAEIRSGDWISFALVALRGVLVITALGACAKYAFTLGKSFTVEALKCADRLHAIAFGRFYLRVYGRNVDWQELKEAFANWNIDRPSAFTSTQVSDFDPKILELLADLARAVSPEKKP
jgi:hypothetical protein